MTKDYRKMHADRRVPNDLVKQLLVLLAVVAVRNLVVAHVSASAQADRGSISQIVAAARAREAKVCASAIVEWSTKERVSPGSFSMSPSVPQIASPRNEVILECRHRLALRGGEWRVDQDGDELFAPPGTNQLGPHRMEKTYVSKGGNIQDYTRVAETGGLVQGQLFHRTGDIDPYLNDVRNLPVLFFARPSSTLLFQFIARGDFEEDLDSLRRKPDYVCLRDKASRATRIQFDPQMGYVPMVLHLPNRTEVEISYADFPNFGQAPSGWSGTTLSADAAPARVWSAEVKSWRTQPAELPDMMDYEFPQGTTVLDLENDRRFVADGRGGASARETAPIPTSNTGRHWSSWLVLLFIVVLAAVLTLRRLRVGSQT